MSVRTPSTAPPGESGRPPAEPPYPWRLFVGMLIAIVLGGAVLALLLGVNPLTFQRLGPPAQPTTIATAQPVVGTTVAAATVAPAIAPTVPLSITLSAPTIIPTQASTPAAGAAPVAAPTLVPIVTAQAPSVPATAAAAPGAFAEPTIAARSGVTSVPTVQAESTPVQAAVSPELAAAILQGYDNYWSVRVRAMGDPTNANVDLESVMVGDELQTAAKTLAQYREAGEAFQATVDHQIWITRATPDEASVVDWFSGKSIKVDPTTKEPLSSEPIIEHFTSTFLLRNFGGTWKVVGQAPGQ